MKGVLISILFFFGPVILMFALRYLGLLLRFWLLWRRQKKNDANVIDITPRKPHPPSVGFIVFAVIVGLLCASLVWMRLAGTSDAQGKYVPAHADEQGRIISGQYRKP